jgi:hypothetical protein
MQDYGTPAQRRGLMVEAEAMTDINDRRLAALGKIEALIPVFHLKCKGLCLLVYLP